MTGLADLTVPVECRDVFHPLAHVSYPDAVEGVALVDGLTFGRLHAMRRRWALAGDPSPVEPDVVTEIEGLFGAELCAALIARARDELVVLHRPDGASAGWSPVRALAADPGDVLARQIVGLVVDMIAATNRELWHLPGLNVTSIQVIRYRPGEGKGWHADGAYDPRLQWVGLIAALTPRSEYGGGELEVDGEPPRKVRRGTVLIVPGHRYHRVLPVTSGERWMLTAFAAQPRNHRNGEPGQVISGSCSTA